MTHIGITVHNAKTMSDIKIPQNGLFTEDFILYSQELNISETILLADIYTMTKKEDRKYIKLNKTIAYMLKTSESTVKRTLNSLDDKGYIKRVFKRYADTGKTHREIIFVNAKMHRLKSNYKK
tara:strand:+ start:2277 stop:2645 length:369 start_codon:yes stop_codon:yes gene_type:complete